jgi:hypothetical protein
MWTGEVSTLCGSRKQLYVSQGYAEKGWKGNGDGVEEAGVEEEGAGTTFE